MQERSLPGVLATMAETTRDLLAKKPAVNRVVLTAALQGFRDKGGGTTTLQALSQDVQEQQGREQGGHRGASSLRPPAPHHLVMVDELAGDGAGAPFVNEVARWLQDEFIECFEDHGRRSPFTVVLVVSDASLANDVVLDRYLNAGSPNTRQGSVSRRARARRPFRLAVTRMKVGSGKSSCCTS